MSFIFTLLYFEIYLQHLLCFLSFLIPWESFQSNSGDWRKAIFLSRVPGNPSPERICACHGSAPSPARSKAHPVRCTHEAKSMSGSQQRPQQENGRLCGRKAGERGSKRGPGASQESATRRRPRAVRRDPGSPRSDARRFSSSLTQTQLAVLHPSPLKTPYFSRLMSG